jgi:hypothetical protein
MVFHKNARLYLRGYTQGWKLSIESNFEELSDYLEANFI